MPTIQTHASLRESTLASIAEFLAEEHFEYRTSLKEGILELIDLLSDYYEEGNQLYPEVILTNDAVGLFKTLPSAEIEISKSEVQLKEFKKALKLCAPLAVGSWIIFIEASGDNMRYGLVSAEMTETSPSIYEQTVGSMKVRPENVNVAYMRNIGSKTVELTGLTRRLVVSLTLADVNSNENKHVEKLAQAITDSCPLEYRDQTKSFIAKTIQDAIKVGHGNLIGVVPDTEPCILKVQKDIDDGIYLARPIDIGSFIRISELEKSRESSVLLISHAQLMKSMLNHDGITIFTDAAKIIGYHMFIRQRGSTDVELVGGARSRAFQAMVNSQLFSACMYKSQDGQSKIWSEQ